MSKGKHRPAVFNPPVRYPNTLGGMIQQVKQAHNEDILRETNNVLNLVTSAYCIVLHEFYDFQEDKLKETLEKVMEQLELCADEIVTIDQMMDLCTEYGLEVTKTAGELDEFGKMMMQKTKAYELLDKGVTEVEDIAKQGNMSSRSASAYRWQWNKTRFGKDYEGDVAMTSKRALAFEMFDKGVKNSSAIAEEIDSTKSSVDTYKKDWKREVLAMLTTEEAAPYFAGEKELWQIKEEKVKSIEANKKTYVAPTKKEEKVDMNEAVEEVSDVEEVKEGSGVAAGEAECEIKQEVKAIQEPEAPVEKKKGLKKVVSYESELDDLFGYKVKDGELYVDLTKTPSTIAGNNILTKEQAIILANELLEIANEM